MFRLIEIFYKENKNPQDNLSYKDIFIVITWKLWYFDYSIGKALEDRQWNPNFKESNFKIKKLSLNNLRQVFHKLIN